MTDKVRFQALERLDLVDANALQTLVYDYIGEALGAIMGYAAGSLSSIHWDVDYNGTLSNAVETTTATPQGFQYYYSQGSELGADGDGSNNDQKSTVVRGQVVTYDPGDEGQNPYGSIDWGSYRTSLQPFFKAVQDNDEAKIIAAGGDDETKIHPFIWARPIRLDTDADSRRQWNIAAGEESAITIKTRSRTITQFKIGATQPVIAADDPHQNKYVVVARIAHWYFNDSTAGVGGDHPDDLFAADGTTKLPNMPIIRTVSVWDTFQNIGGAATSATGTGVLGEGAWAYMRAPGSPKNLSNKGKGTKLTQAFELGYDGFGNVLPPGQPDSSTNAHTFNTEDLDTPHAIHMGTPAVSHMMQGRHAPEEDEQDNQQGYFGQPYLNTSLIYDGLDFIDAPLDRLGLPALLTIMRERQLRHISAYGNKSWHRKPDQGLDQLRQRVLTLEQTLDDSYYKQFLGWSNHSIFDHTSIKVEDPFTNVAVVGYGQVFCDLTKPSIAYKKNANGDFISNEAKLFVNGFGFVVQGSIYQRDRGRTYCILEVDHKGYDEIEVIHVDVTPMLPGRVGNDESHPATLSSIQELFSGGDSAKQATMNSWIKQENGAKLPFIQAHIPKKSGSGADIGEDPQSTGKEVVVVIDHLRTPDGELLLIPQDAEETEGYESPERRNREVVQLDGNALQTEPWFRWYLGNFNQLVKPFKPYHGGGGTPEYHRHFIDGRYFHATNRSPAEVTSNEEHAVWGEPLDNVYKGQDHKEDIYGDLTHTEGANFMITIYARVSKDPNLEVNTGDI